MALGDWAKRPSRVQFAGLAVTILSCAALGETAPASTQTFSSSYTSTAPKNCRLVGRPSGLDDSTTRVCPGRSALVVLVSEGDLRETVSVGRNCAEAAKAAAKEPASGSRFGPIAKPMLAVTRLPPGAVCPVADIDGQASRNPNELARQAADDFARDFKCGEDEARVIGERGRGGGIGKAMIRLTPGALLPH